MNCSEFDRELELLVEARHGSLTESAATHATTCVGCRQRWYDHRLVDMALQQWRPVVIPPSLAKHVLGDLFQERPPLISTVNADHRSRWTVVAVAAACLMLTLGLGIVVTPGTIESRIATSKDDRRMPDSPGNSPSHGQPSVEVASSVVAVIDDLRTEYRELAAETRATAREFAVVLPTPDVSPWSDLGSSEVSRPLPSDRQVQVGAAEGTASTSAVSVIGRSIGSQIGEAMDFLWVAVPAGVPRG